MTTDRIIPNVEDLMPERRPGLRLPLNLPTTGAITFVVDDPAVLAEVIEWAPFEVAVAADGTAVLRIHGEELVGAIVGADGEQVAPGEAGAFVLTGHIKGDLTAAG